MKPIATHSAAPAPAIGIDLGTTYSCVGVYQNGQVHIIANDQGYRTTPSYVHFSPDGTRLVGEAAKLRAVTDLETTIFDVKRIIGRPFFDLNVQNDCARWPFHVEKMEDGSPCIVMGETRLRIEEVSAVVLRKMKQIAEEFLGRSVTNAVITVPAYFNDAQRHATKTAGTIAGLDVIRVISEPTAAAMAYGLGGEASTLFRSPLSPTAATAPLARMCGSSVTKPLDSAKEKIVLVFDLGGGTFDVSLLSIEGALFHVMATAGDCHLGGNDFDQRLVDYCIEDLTNKHTEVFVRNNTKKTRRRLTSACERAKRVLSSATQAVIKVESLIGDFDYECIISRAKFEDINADIFARCMEPVQQVLKDAKI